MKHSDETKRRISETNEGKILSEEHKLKISKKLKGRRLSEEIKEKISNTLKGRKRPQEIKDKISKSHKGKIFSEEHKKNLSKGQINRTDNRKHSEETKIKIRESNLGKKRSEETKKKISNVKSGSKNQNWKGGITKKNISLFETLAPKLKKYESIRCTEEGYLEVKCTYCGKWYIPKATDIGARLDCINGRTRGEGRLYCSNECKQECPIYGKLPRQLMKEDAIRAGRIPPEELNREVQPELRQMVFLRDNYTCLKCGSTKNLHCHHYDPVIHNDIESTDIDNCGTYCKKCHLELHKEGWCKDLVYCRKKQEHKD